MIFTNPWGLLTLLAVPAILGLHFFRSQRRVRVVGGLHLWQFARTRLPVGRRLQRILRSLSLLFQLLAAVLLSLLAAGFDIPRESADRRYTIVLDDTLSMDAGAPAPETAASRARVFVKGWAPARARYTLIAAGPRPRVIAGPFAERGEMFDALDAWRPEAAAYNLDEAMNLAAKFAAADEAGGAKPLVLTDRPDLASSYAAFAVVHGLGRPLGNAGFEFADRRRIADKKDRVLLRLRLWDDKPRAVKLRATVAGQAILDQTITCEPDTPQEFAFETDHIADTLVLNLDDDALAADNIVKLAPAVAKTVIVGLHGLEKQASFFRRAAFAVPGTRVLDGFEDANLVFSTLAPALPMDRLFHVCVMPDTFLATKSSIAQGRGIWLDRRDPVVENVSMDGVLWAYDPATTVTLQNADALATFDGRVLLASSDGPQGRRTYEMNLLVDRTNIFAQPAWPAMMQRMIEACRESLPGIARSNFRLGESVTLNLPPDVAPGGVTLTRDGAEFSHEPAPPESIVEPAVGEWRLTAPPKPASAGAPGAQPAADAAPVVELAHFCVNLFVPDESNLRPGATNEFKAADMESDAVKHTEMNRPLFYAMLLVLTVLIALSWFFQDLSR